MSAQAIPGDIRSAARGCICPKEAVASSGLTIARIERAILAERQKHDFPTSPDLQAEADRVFAEIDRLVQVKDVVAALAKALQAAKDEEREICALICEAMASTDSEWPEADAALRRAAKNIRGA